MPSIPVHTDGLGAFRLGARLETAARQVAALDRAALMLGPGCDTRDQSVVTVVVEGLPMTVMAMANTRGRIEEVVASAPHEGPAVSEAVCQSRALHWAQALSPRLGGGQPAAPLAHGAARVGKIRFAREAWVEARWFPGGRSCDLSLHFSPRHPPLAVR
ncbi:MAG: hypothetical protein WEK74_08270 [Hydrogenophaga sp.]